MKKHLLFLLSLATAAFAVSCGSDKKAGNNWLAEDDVNVAFD